MQLQPTDPREQPLCLHTTSSHGCQGHNQAASASSALLHFSVPCPSSVPMGWEHQGLASLAAGADGRPQPSPALVPLPTTPAGWPAQPGFVLAMALSSQDLSNPQHGFWGDPGLTPNWSSDPERKGSYILPRVQDRAGKGCCDGGGNTCAGITVPFPTCSPCPCPMNG